MLRQSYAPIAGHRAVPGSAGASLRASADAAGAGTRIVSTGLHDRWSRTRKISPATGAFMLSLTALDSTVLAVASMGAVRDTHANARTLSVRCRCRTCHLAQLES